MNAPDTPAAAAQQPKLFETGPSKAALWASAADGALKAVIVRVTFPPAESGWTVLRIRYDGNQEGTAVGSMLDPHEGEIVALHGDWVEDRKWGRQFRFDSYVPQPPTNAEEAQAYLSSAKIPGIGKSLAADIVAHFGDQTLHVLEDDIGRLTEVYGIGPKKLKTITEGWAETAKQRAIAIVLAEVGAPTALAVPIWEAFGADGAVLVKSNPYALTKARGVGFIICDKIAAFLGWERTDPRRISAGLAHTIETAQGDGHCYLPVADLIERAVRLLGVRPDRCVDAVQTAVDEERLVVEEDRVYTRHMHYLETDLAAELKRLAGARLQAPSPPQQREIDKLLADRGLTDEQEGAVRAVLTTPLTVLTGGPGVGKSHTVATIAAAAWICHWQVELCAPTGRAAKRMSELADGAPAATVHRLIGLGRGDDGGARYDPEAHLPADLVVCDEASMLDVSLARHLMRAIKRGARVLLVGDIDQLPSVGPGSVLRDVIDSGIASVTSLTQIFRQGRESGIVQVAHAINAGNVPDLTGWLDLHFWPTAKPDEAADRVVEMVCDRIPAKFSKLTVRDIQVLAPQRKGSCGVLALNARLQARLNPPSGPEFDASIGEDRVVYRVGDRVMVIKNNYDKGPETEMGPTGVFNGTPARVVAVDPEPDKDEAAVTIETEEGHTIEYTAKEVKNELALAYAITIHKSQGSQYPCVVIPVTMQSFKMLVRNLIYTAITRAQAQVVLVGSPRAIAKAVKTLSAVKRCTGLADRLAARR
jgi:exodeoxyribonuclease V alpha subunit